MSRSPFIFAYLSRASIKEILVGRAYTEMCASSIRSVLPTCSFATGRMDVIAMVLNGAVNSMSSTLSSSSRLGGMAPMTGTVRLK